MKEVHACIITIGDELLIGQTIDTNSAFIAQKLNEKGIWVKQCVAIGDVKEDILNTLAEQSRISSIIIITGGLGPTADDITKPALCSYFNSKLELNKEVEAHVAQIFARNNRPLTARNRTQAEVPNNCTVLHNARGTAPGMWFEKEDVVYVSLPGVPAEMEGLMEDEVLPKLQIHFKTSAIIHKTAVTFGQPESALADGLKTFEKGLPAHIKLAYLPSNRMVKLRITGRAEDKEALEKEMDRQFETLKKGVAEWLVADEDISIAEVVGKLLNKYKYFVASAESCTGGYIAHLLTEHSGSSASFKGSVVSYSNDVKENALGVQHATLVKWGAVSEETVLEMVTGVRDRLNVDYAVATSGIMGPNGGTKEKPVGTVWIAVANKEKASAKKHFVPLNRKRNIELTASFALNMLRQFIVDENE